jgi:hypothetical protein
MFLESGASKGTVANSKALFNISFWVPSKGALPAGPPHGIPSEKDIPCS